MCKTNTNTDSAHPIYDELKHLAEQSVFSMHCVTLHYSVDGFEGMAEIIRDIHYALLDNLEITDDDRNKTKSVIAQFFEDAVNVRKAIEVLRLREMNKKGKTSSEP